jgi:hypothetical protein
MAVLAVILGAGVAKGGAPELEEGVRIQENGKPIDVKVGHLVPVVVDWDQDGKKDLLVGQFLGGKIRFYRNTGSDDAPLFNGFSFLRAGEVEISLPAG